jgi:hypothetical protein
VRGRERAVDATRRECRQRPLRRAGRACALAALLSLIPLRRLRAAEDDASEASQYTSAGSSTKFKTPSSPAISIGRWTCRDGRTSVNRYAWC